MPTLAEKQLAQAVATTGFVSIYSSGSGVTTIVKGITMVNTTATARTIEIAIDVDGTTYDATTTVFETTLGPNETLTDDAFRAMQSGVTGNIAIKSDGASAVTVTVDGAEVT